MSKLLSQKSYMFDTDIGSVVVHTKIFSEYDVEDVIRNRAISQARLIQFINIGKTVDPNRPTYSNTKSSIFLNNSEEVGI